MVIYKKPIRLGVHVGHFHKRQSDESELEQRSDIHLTEELPNSIFLTQVRRRERGEEHLKRRKKTRGRRQTRGSRMWAHFNDSTKPRQYFAMPKLP